MLDKNPNRIPEIDALRGVAIILMVIFHIIVDLTDFFHFPFDYRQGFWNFEGKSSAILFLFLAGISATFSRSAVRHGLQLLVWGLVITACTRLLFPELYIRFGILHLLGVSLLTWPLLVTKKPGTLLLLAGCCLIVGHYLASLTAPIPWLLPLGLMPTDFASMDYYPLFPWYGVFLCGLAAGKQFYPAKTALFPGIPAPALLVWLGRRSLAIYLVHQPVILAVLYLIL